ncbi:MAG: GNAT family N-acetyltransferase [Deltaproteobacteria bacterium]|nr:GNAT family N-acetyltransferase [Deltaproteobacteria bacterium]
MINYVTYRKFVALRNGQRVMFRFLNAQDRQNLLKLFQDAPDEDIRFLKQNVKDSKLINFWIDNIDYQKVLPLVAVNMEDNTLIADATLHRGKHASKHIGEIRIFVSRSFRNQGLGSIMLDELINLARLEGLQILKAEVLIDHKGVLKAFKSKGFELKCILDDFFLRKDGMTHDVALLIRPVVRREEAEF